MKKIKFVFLILILSAFSLHLGAQCTGTNTLTLGNGNDGEGIAFNPNDGLLYHTSGISDGQEFLETINPTTLAIGANLVPGDTYGPSSAQEISGIVWYPPLNAFIVMDRDENIYSVTTGGVFTQIATYTGSYLRGFAVVGASIYGVVPGGGGGQLIEFNPNTGAEISNIQMTDGGSNVNKTTGLTTHPITGDVYVVFEDPVDGLRHLGTVDLVTGVITDLGDMGDNFAGITFDASGNLFAISGEGATTPSTLFGDFSCTPPITLSTVPTLGEWGLITFTLLILNMAILFVVRRRKRMSIA